MSVPTNLIPTKITGLPEYTGSSTLGYLPYILDGQTFKVQFANIAAVGAVPSTRVIASGTGLAGGGDLSADRVISIAAGGVGVNQLSLTGVTAGTYGSGSAVPVLTVDATGRVTSATTAALNVTGFVPTSRTITAGNGLTGGGSLASDITLSASFSATTPLALGIASPGVAITLSRGDHVHPALDLSDTNQTQGALPLGRGGTGDALSPVAGAVVYSTGTKFAVSTAGAPGQILVSNGTAAPSWTNVGAGTVTSVAVATANGLAGTVANPTVSPVITLSTTVTGVVKGDGTTLSAATAGTDYVAPGAYTASGLTMATARLLGRTTASVGAAQELTVGTGLTLASGSLVNAAPDQVVSLTAGTAISVTGTYPSFSVANTAPDQVVSLTAGTAISVTGTYPSFSVTNTAPDQVVSLTGAGTTTITGTYPSFTITSNDSAAGTVTSINASGGTTGMSFTGGPVTSAGTLTLNGTLAVSNGGTGATDAVAALTNLGAYPASNPSGFTSNVGTVTSVSGTGTVSGLSLSGTVTSTGSLTLGGTLAVLPSNFASQTANTVLAAPNGSAGTPTFRAIVAADIPTLNQNTTGTASNVTGIVAVANGGTGANVAATARTNLSAAASGANTDITSIALTTGTISTSPVSGTDIVNKAYADSIASGINFHQSVRLATAAALPANTYNNGTSGVGATLTANANGALSVDGVAVVAGNRILVKDEVAGANNGVYVVTQVGSGSTPYILTRATDFDSAGTGVDQIDAGDFFLVTAGSTLSNTSWVQQTPLPITVGTTPITFTQFAAPVLYSAGTGLTLTGTVFSITNTGVSASTYGSASSVPVIAVNAQGQLTSASSSAIAIAASQITSGALAIANGGTGATSAATALTNLGAYPASNPSGFTSNTGTVTSVNLTAGTGVSVSGGPITTSGSITVTNTAPDQVVALTGAGATTVTGTYPNFTISSPTSGAGTVTSINVSGGTTGLTTSGGPVTTSGTITLAGTLNVANGGTGATTLSSGYLLKGNGTSAVSASVIYDNGTNASIGTTSPGARFEVYQSAGGTNSIRMNTNFVGGNSVDLNPSISGVSNGGFSIALNGTIYQVISASGNVGVGTTAPVSKFHVSVNASTLPPTSSAEQILTVSGADGASTRVLIDAFGGNPGIHTRRANGTAASPTAVLAGNYLGFLSSWGYGTTAYAAGSQVRIGLLASENWTDTARGTYIVFDTTADGSTAIAERMRINNAGNVGIGVTAPPQLLAVGNATDQFGAGISAAVTTAYFGSPSSGSGGIKRIAYDRATGNMSFIGGSVASPSTQMTLDSSGNLGIGTASPGQKLEVNGITKINTASATWEILQLVNTQASSGAYMQMVGAPGGTVAIGADATTASTMIFRTAATERMRLNASGEFLIGTTTGGRAVCMSAADMWLRMSSPSRAWLLGPATGTAFNIYDETAGTNRFTIDTSGAVTAIVDMRAPIFYDSNNTGFFIDPASTSSLITLLAQNLGVYDSGVANDPYGKIAVTRAADANNYSYYGLTRSGQLGAGFGIDTVNRFWWGQATAGYAGVAATIGMTMSMGGTLSVTADVRAPIFYDSANTAYYVDPVSGSRLGGNVTFDGGSYVAANGDFIARRSSGLTGVYYFVTTGNAYLYYDGSSYIFGSSGPVTTSTSFRAPIFYDSDNTAFYINPNSTSAVSGAIIIGPNSSSQYTRIGGDGGNTDMATLSSSNGNLHIDAKAGNNLYLSWYNTATTQVGGGIAATVFYDRDNTAYFIDPTATQSIRTVGDWRADSSAWTGEFNGKIQYHINNWYFQAAGSWEFRRSDSANAFSVNQAGAATALASFNAPIFYDSNDTSAYVDPAGASWIKGGFQMTVPSPSNEPFGGLEMREAGLVANTQTAATYAPGINFHWGSIAAARIYMASSGAFVLGAQGDITNGRRTLFCADLNATGNVTAYYSDERLKTRIGKIDNALDIVSKLSGFRYVNNDLAKSFGYESDEVQLGVSAQEVEVVLPEVVRQAAFDMDLDDPDGGSKSGENYKTVQYDRLVPLLIEAIKELTDKVKALEAKEQ